MIPSPWSFIGPTVNWFQFAYSIKTVIVCNEKNTIVKHGEHLNKRMVGAIQAVSDRFRSKSRIEVLLRLGSGCIQIHFIILCIKLRFIIFIAKFRVARSYEVS